MWQRMYLFINVIFIISPFSYGGGDVVGNFTTTTNNATSSVSSGDNSTWSSSSSSSESGGGNKIPEMPPALPPEGDVEKEHRSSMAIFFILIIIAMAILLVHFLLTTKLHFIPDSLAVVFLGSVVGFVLSLTGKDWSNEEAFSPNMFFLILLPPIIFESGYNLHKGNFFANFGSILVFAVVGTFISSLVIGGGIYILGQAGLIYSLSAVESFAFGSLVSAVDPVATLAIFQAIKVDQVLYMLVFGESMLNDAVAIVLATTISELDQPEMRALSAGSSIMTSVARFCLVFFGSAGIGIVTGLFSALLLKFVNLHNTPSLEYGFILLFAYLPYGLAEAINLSGIMAILFCGIVMSHYTHFNLSAVTQVTVQQTFRTLAFMAETCVFAYLGLALFTFPLVFEPAFICWCIILCLLARAANIFPLARLLNHFREYKITPQMQFLLWFSGTVERRGSRHRPGRIITIGTIGRIIALIGIPLTIHEGHTNEGQTNDLGAIRASEPPLQIGGNVCVWIHIVYGTITQKSIYRHYSILSYVLGISLRNGRDLFHSFRPSAPQHSYSR